MTIDPDRDLLIFRVREERKASIASKRAAPARHNINFNLAEDIAGISKRVPRIKSIFERAAKRKPERVEEQIRQPGMPEKERVVEGPVVAQGAEGEEQIIDMEEKVNSILDTMRKINERQKIISSKIE